MESKFNMRDGDLMLYARNRGNSRRGEGVLDEVLSSLTIVRLIQIVTRIEKAIERKKALKREYGRCLAAGYDLELLITWFFGTDLASMLPKFDRAFEKCAEYFAHGFLEPRTDPPINRKSSNNTTDPPLNRKSSNDKKVANPIDCEDERTVDADEELAASIMAHSPTWGQWQLDNLGEPCSEIWFPPSPGPKVREDASLEIFHPPSPVREIENPELEQLSRTPSPCLPPPSTPPPTELMALFKKHSDTLMHKSSKKKKNVPDEAPETSLPAGPKLEKVVVRLRNVDNHPLLKGTCHDDHELELVVRVPVVKRRLKEAWVTEAEPVEDLHPPAGAGENAGRPERVLRRSRESEGGSGGRLKVRYETEKELINDFQPAGGGRERRVSAIPPIKEDHEDRSDNGALKEAEEVFLQSAVLPKREEEEEEEEEKSYTFEQAEDDLFEVVEFFIKEEE